MLGFVGSPPELQERFYVHPRHEDADQILACKRFPTSYLAKPNGCEFERGGFIVG